MPEWDTEAQHEVRRHTLSTCAWHGTTDRLGAADVGERHAVEEQRRDAQHRHAGANRRHASRTRLAGRGESRELREERGRARRRRQYRRVRGAARSGQRREHQHATEGGRCSAACCARGSWTTCRWSRGTSCFSPQIPCGAAIGSYFLVFNTLLNFDNLNAGRKLDAK